MSEKPIQEVDDLADDEFIGIAIMSCIIVCYCVMTVCSLIRITWWVSGRVGDFAYNASLTVGSIAGLATFYGGIYLLIVLIEDDVLDGGTIVLYFVLVMMIVIDLCALITVFQTDPNNTQSTTDFDDLCCCLSASQPAPVQVPPPQIQILSNNVNNNNNNNNNNDLNAIEMGVLKRDENSNFDLDVENVFLWFGGKYSKQDCRIALLESDKDVQKAIDMLSDEEKLDKNRNDKVGNDSTAITDAVKLIQEQVECSEQEAVNGLKHCDYHIDGAVRYLKLNLLVQMSGVDRKTARMALTANANDVDRAFLSLDK